MLNSLLGVSVLFGVFLSCFGFGWAIGALMGTYRKFLYQGISS